MAPKNIEQQTYEIISSLFEDLDVQTRSGCEFGNIETDGHDDDSFDPVLIADKLREWGDDFDENRIQPLISKLQQAAAEQALAAFEQAVEELCQRSPVAQRAEVAPEMQLLRASVALGLYVKKRSPHLVDKVKDAMGAFVNNRLAGWVKRQGGWDQVTTA